MSKSAGSQNNEWISILSGSGNIDNPRISFCILTAPRRECYFDRTLESLNHTGFFNEPTNLPIDVVLGAPTSEPLIYKHSQLHVHPMDSEEAQKMGWHVAGPPLRATWGHWRCLTRKLSDKQAILVMEDDIVFARGWLKRLNLIARELFEKFLDQWLLTLYTPSSTEPLEAFKNGRTWILRSYEGFFGAQALLYPLAVRDAYLRYIARPEWSQHLPHDLALPLAMKELGIPILATAPCLVQHMGLVSEGVSGSQHQSMSFLENLS